MFELKMLIYLEQLENLVTPDLQFCRTTGDLSPFDAAYCFQLSMVPTNLRSHSCL
jgi:hypothetical protein